MRTWEQIEHTQATKTEAPILAVDMLDRAQLAWSTELHPAFANVGGEGDLQLREAVNHRAIVRMDNHDVLGMSSPRYTPIANVELAELADAISGGAGWCVAAGHVRGGRRVWFQLELPEPIEIPGDGTIKPYVFVTGTHDGSGNVLAGYTAIRMWCNNQLYCAIRGLTERVQIKHSASAKQRMKDAAALMKGARDFYQGFRGFAQAMLDTRFTDGQMRRVAEIVHPVTKRDLDREARLVAELAAKHTDDVARDSAAVLADMIADHGKPVPVPAHVQERRDDLVEIFQGAGAGIEHIKGTAWAALNAVVEQVDHGRNYRSEETRLGSMLWGDARAIKSRALREILAQTQLDEIAGRSGWSN